jgi:hypothetical protein
LAPCISLLSSKGVLATIYSFRAIISISILLTLMVRAELTQRNDKESKPALLSHEGQWPGVGPR